MPLPKPKYQPQFTAEQLAEARRIAAQHSAPVAQVRRAQLTLRLAEFPELSHGEIGALCGLDGETVYKWRRRWATQGWSLPDAPRSGRPRAFPPPETTTLVKALACERPTDGERRPLSRFSVFDVCERAWALGLNPSYSTVWRWLHADALRPWLQEQWLFPRDPRFLEKATPVLELYHRRWQGQPLGPREVVLCGDEMTNLQALERHHRGFPPAPGRRGRYEFEYERHGTVCYLAFLEVFTGRVYGEVTAQNGIAPFERALRHCLQQERLAAAERVFLIVDNGCAHHPRTSPARLRQQFSQVEVVHLPTHASWLNQIEIYFFIVRRKALTPLNFPSKAALQERLGSFQGHYNRRATPFTWNYTQEQLAQHLEMFAAHEGEHTRAQELLQAQRDLHAGATHCRTN